MAALYHTSFSLCVSLSLLRSSTEYFQIQALAAHKYIIKYFINVWYTYGFLLLLNNEKLRLIEDMFCAWFYYRKSEAFSHFQIILYRISPYIVHKIYLTLLPSPPPIHWTQSPSLVPSSLNSFQSFPGTICIHIKCTVLRIYFIQNDESRVRKIG